MAFMNYSMHAIRVFVVSGCLEVCVILSRISHWDYVTRFDGQGHIIATFDLEPRILKQEWLSEVMPTAMIHTLPNERATSSEPESERR
jgi:hypothetical protein